METVCIRLEPWITADGFLFRACHRFPWGKSEKPNVAGTVLVW